MYSQRDEEKHIIDHLPRDGRFLDIGAYDGKTFSNTRRLHETGWGGVCVEPSPCVFVELMKNAAGLTLVNCAVDIQAGLSIFHESNGDAIGTLNQAHRDKWAGQVSFQPVIIRTITLEELLCFVGYDFDFINIDTEGLSVDLFAALPFSKLTKLKGVCVEYDGDADRVHLIGESQGFSLVYKSEENMLMIKGARQ